MMDGPVYLDNNATTPIAPGVIEVISHSLKDDWGNASSNHEYGRKAKQAVQHARGQVAAMLQARATDIVFMSGGTEVNHTVLNIFSGSSSQKSQKDLVSGDSQDQITLPHIITTTIEHDSIKLPLEKMIAEKLIDVTFVPVNPATCSVEVKDVIGAIQPNTALVSVMLANNETGVIQPVAEISRAVREYNKRNRRSVYIHTDAAQAIGKIVVSVQQLGVDYLTVVGHKFYGPRIGALYVRNLGEPDGDCPFKPVFLGGGQERGFRSGTENTAMIAGLGAACQLVTDNITQYQQHMENMRNYLETQLSNKLGNDLLAFNGRSEDTPRLPNTCNVSILEDNCQGRLVLERCPQVIASVGAACHSQHGSNEGSAILRLSGIPVEHARNALRLSVGRYTTRQDIDSAVEFIWQAVKELRSAKDGN